MLHIAYPLVDGGYRVRILDMRIQDYRTFKFGDPVFVGISSMSGLQIHYGLELAEKVRTELPSCPIVWGGVHPSLLPEQTTASPYVDIVVRGEGEPVMAKLANNLSAGNRLDYVAGITYKVAGEIKSNPECQPIDLDSVPIELPFDLLPLDKYPSLRAGRFHIQTSRGCPHRCGYCYNTLFNKCGWRGKSAERVLDEIEYILEKYPNVKTIDPIDDNFFADRKRAENICRGLIQRKINVTWRANCRFDYLSSYSRDFINLMEKSGCTELDFGGETGSERLLTLIHKEITPTQMVQSVENLKNWAPTIKPYVSWMSGLPTETDEDLKLTFDLMDRMSDVNPNTQHFGIFVFTPFPSPLVESLGSQLKTPQSLEGWSDIDAFHFKPSWHSKKYVEKLHAVSAVTRYAFFPSERIREHNISFKIGYGFLNRTARFRWKSRYFGLPLELKLANTLAKKFRGWV